MPDFKTPFRRHTNYSREYTGRQMFSQTGLGYTVIPGCMGLAVSRPT